MSRKKHQNKTIEAALKFAEANGWLVVNSGKSAHSSHIMKCPLNEKCRGGFYCTKSVWSTPVSPEGHARDLRNIIVKCTGAK